MEYIKDHIEKIKEIQNSLMTIEEIVSTLPKSSWRNSLDTSVVNFKVKVDNFLVVKPELTEAQKKAIAAIKSGKVSEADISALSACMEKRTDGASTEAPAEIFSEASAEGNDEQQTENEVVPSKKVKSGKHH